MKPYSLIVASTLLLLPLAACGSNATDTTSPATGDTALDQSATMGTTTQQQVSGTDASLGDAVSGTSTGSTVDQYGPTSGASGGTGDATTDTTATGTAGGVSGATTSGFSGSSTSVGNDTATSGSGGSSTNSSTGQ